MTADKADDVAPREAATMTAEQALERLAGDAGSSGLLLDFDGTLVPIVYDPAVSRLSEPVAGVLTDLAQRLALVAVVSGRPVSFLGRRVDLPGVRLLGLYGLQEWRDGQIDVRPEARPWQPVIDALRPRLTRQVEALDGVRLEDKGLSLALHWRGAHDPEAAARTVRALAAATAAETGLAVEPGKLVEELRPPVRWDKGSGVRALAAEFNLRELVYIGDDLGDVAAFRALRELGGVGIAVHAGEETDPRLLAAADVVLEGTDAVGRWLTTLRDRLSG